MLASTDGGISNISLKVLLVLTSPIRSSIVGLFSVVSNTYRYDLFYSTDQESSKI